MATLETLAYKCVCIYFYANVKSITFRFYHTQLLTSSFPTESGWRKKNGKKNKACLVNIIAEHQLYYKYPCSTIQCRLFSSGCLCAPRVTNIIRCTHVLNYFQSKKSTNVMCLRLCFKTGCYDHAYWSTLASSWQPQPLVIRRIAMTERPFRWTRAAATTNMWKIWWLWNCTEAGLVRDESI